MSGPLYVPVLPTRPHTAAAYRALPPDVQARLTPLWTLPPRPGMLPDLLAAELRKDTGRVAAVQRHRAAWLDAPFADETESVALADTLPPGWWAERSLRPVTGPGRPGTQQSLALTAARESGDGLGIRIPIPGEWNDRAAAQVCALLTRTGPSVPVDLLVDLAAVPPTRTGAAKEALRALDALVPLTRWRAVVVAGGGFPEPPQDFREGTWYEEPRPDWDSWREIHQSGRAYLPQLRYGDYGILPAAYTARAPMPGHGGPPWGILRYTRARSYLLAKALQRGDNRDEVNRDTARRLIRTEDFRGPSAGAGETWLRDCAQGSVTTGNHSVWNRVGNIQHMTFVVHGLAVAADG